MLAYFLAIVMAMISLTLYFNAFISPKIHRQDDFLWSGLGLFYALTLWICAGKITGTVLLGQLAVVSLVVAFIWENRQIRKLIVADTESNNGLEGFSLLSFILTSFNKISQLAKKKTPVVTKKTPSKTEEKTPEIKENLEVKSEENKPLPKETVEEKVTVIITEKPLEEDTQTVESVIEEVIKEEIEVDLNEISTSENNLDDDFDIDSLGLSKSTDNITNESEKSKGNIFTKFLGFFRKSSPQNKDEKETSESVIETKESEIDPNISATEVETAIENLDLVESNNDNEEVKETTEENDLTENSLKEEEIIKSTANEVERETVESITEDAETETVESITDEVETETVESITDEVETETIESITDEVETETIESITDEVETETVESVSEDAETETIESITDEVETETIESIAEEVETETVESITEDVETEAENSPQDTIIDEDSSIEQRHFVIEPPSTPDSDNIKSV